MMRVFKRFARVALLRQGFGGILLRAIALRRTKSCEAPQVRSRMAEREGKGTDFRPAINSKGLAGALLPEIAPALYPVSGPNPEMIAC